MTLNQASQQARDSIAQAFRDCHKLEAIAREIESEMLSHGHQLTWDSPRNLGFETQHVAHLIHNPSWLSGRGMEISIYNHVIHMYDLSHPNYLGQVGHESARTITCNPENYTYQVWVRAVHGNNPIPEIQATRETYLKLICYQYSLWAQEQV